MKKLYLIRIRFFISYLSHNNLTMHPYTYIQCVCVCLCIQVCLYMYMIIPITHPKHKTQIRVQTYSLISLYNLLCQEIAYEASF